LLLIRTPVVTMASESEAPVRIVSFVWKGMCGSQPRWFTQSKTKRALLIIDVQVGAVLAPRCGCVRATTTTLTLLRVVQNDFCSGGSLAVPDGDATVPVINELRKKSWDMVVLTQDWHPSGERWGAAEGAAPSAL